MEQQNPYYYEEEEEIDIKIMLYKALSHWRKAINWGVILGLLFMLWSLYGSLSIVLDKDSYTKELNSFEAAYSGWESTETVLNQKIDDLKNQKERQKEYNKKSELMKIDPFEKWVGKYSAFIDAGYKINPNLSYQSTDYTAKILAAYSSYINNGEFYETVMKQTDYSEQKYLREILSIYIDPGAATVEVTVTGKDEKSVNGLITIVKSALGEKSKIICSSVAEHSISDVNSVIYSEVDYDLQDIQNNNTNSIQQYDVEISKINDEIIEWKDSDEPRFDYSAGRIIRKCIKWAIIGGIAGVCLVCGYYGLTYIITGKFSKAKLKSCGGDYIIAYICGDKPPVERKIKLKAFDDFDKWLEKVFAVKPLETGFKESCQLAGSSIKRLMEETGAESLAIIGHIDEDRALEIERQLNRSCRVDYVGDILTNPKAVDRLENYSFAAIMAAEEDNTLEEVRREYENLKAFGKKNLGAIIIL